uniref:Unannotated protein n=1 Tax=freshwater metagenome TaxID=449393 RepID=A0A6J5ZDE4_9ZZZZ
MVEDLVELAGHCALDNIVLGELVECLAKVVRNLFDLGAGL